MLLSGEMYGEMAQLASQRAIREKMVMMQTAKFPIRRTVGESVNVEADVFADGRRAASCVCYAAATALPSGARRP